MEKNKMRKVSILKSFTAMLLIAFMLNANFVMASVNAKTPTVKKPIPPANVKALFEKINLLRTAPSANSNMVADMSQKHNRNYKNDSFWTGRKGNGKTGLENISDLASTLNSKTGIAALVWDDNLAKVAQNRGKPMNKTYRPEYLQQQYSDPAEKAIMWLVVNGVVSQVTALLDSNLKYIGIAKLGNDVFIVASKREGKFFSMTDAEIKKNTDPLQREKDFLNRINLLRTTPSANSNMVADMSEQHNRNYKTDRFWTDRKGNGRTGLENISDFASFLNKQGKASALIWDDDLAEIAKNKGKSKNSMYKPEYAPPVQGSDPAEKTLIWWVVNGFSEYAKNALNPKLKYVGIAQMGTSVYIVASANKGKLFTRTDVELAKLPFDARGDSKAPKDTSYNLTLPPNISSFVKSDGTLDVVWRGQGSSNQVYLSRYKKDGSLVWTKAVPGVNAGTYPLLAGFTEDSDGNIYILRAQDEGYMDKKTTPATPKVNGKPDMTYDRPEIMKLTKLDKDGTVLWTKNLAKKGGSASAFFAPMAKMGDQANGTSQIIHTTIQVNGKNTPVIFALYGAATDYDYDPKYNSRHQNAYWRIVDANTGEPINDKNGPAMGHSFDMDLIVADEGIISVERNDVGFVMANYLANPHDRNHKAYVFQHNFNGNNSFSELGSLRKASNGYLFAFTSNRSTSPVRAIAGNVSAVNAEYKRPRDIAVLRINKNFTNSFTGNQYLHTLKSGVPDSKLTQPVPSSIFGLQPKYITTYNNNGTGNYSASRPKMVSLGGDNFIVLWERWTHKAHKANSAGYIEYGGEYDSTWAKKINKDGSISATSTKLDARITRGDQPVLWNGKATWLTGNVVEGKLIAHTLDSNLKYKKIALSIK